MPRIHGSWHGVDGGNCELIARPGGQRILFPPSLGFQPGRQRSPRICTAWQHAPDAAAIPPLPNVLILGANSGVASPPSRSLRCSTRASSPPPADDLKIRSPRAVRRLRHRPLPAKNFAEVRKSLTFEGVDIVSSTWRRTLGLKA